MHQKHIVHRDLKLENLLLSKDRNILITDFGFANRFQIEHQDLMATSCGSPCYAAPELVINDDDNNHYVGTAVDIWSCGVILFAMLCGYLPFDDDPNNPQGANIHLLYKYIISTPLELPTSMSEDAKDLLRRMLVPDPRKRCQMNDILDHPWLQDYHNLLHKSMEELEQMASDTRFTLSVSPNTQTNISESREQDVQEHGAICVTNTDDVPSLIVEEKEEEEEEEEESHPSTPEEQQKTTLFQSKFFSAISRHVSVKIPQFNNIPTRSQSVQARPRTISDIQPKPQAFDILPSVSEQTTIQKKSKGQKLKDWFKRKNTPSTKSTIERLGLPERPLSTINPIRAMPIGKPLGSYAADFNDSKLRIHRGAVDQDALTSKAPNEVLFTIKEALTFMGICMKRVHDFKIKCIRPSRQQQQLQQLQLQQQQKRTSLKLFFHHNLHNNINNNNNRHKVETMYGEQGIDNGDQVQFTVELSKIENLPGLYVVDIRRIRGNIWAFKFLYHTLLDLLDLRNGGYMAHRRVSFDEKQNRISYLTTSTHSTNDFY
ncbi:Putative CAMK/CAMKL/KIN4 protein kinase [Rhizopus microsporus]|nr:Putative CAMK/CAMKL/KIN4 protein kinase [Rhizopus microsporus]